MALIIRVVPDPSFPLPAQDAQPPTLSEFFELDWVNAPNARPEVLFLKRSSPADPTGTPQSNEAHVSFPGGRMEEGDENGLYTGACFSLANVRVTVTEC